MDISTELQVIESAELGNDVRIAVASAAEKLSENRDADITSELSIIQNGRYGIDIREAIYDTLRKLAESTPEPSPSGGAQVGNAVPVARGTMLTHVGQAQRATTVIDMMDYEWETGSGNTNTGAFDNDLSTRLRCNTFIPVPPARSSAILSAFANNAVGLESVIYWYAAESDASYLGYHAWAVNGTELPMPSTAQFFRLNLKIDNETDMVPADLASCAVTFLS